jgi:hypothetical protein
VFAAGALKRRRATSKRCTRANGARSWSTSASITAWACSCARWPSASASSTSGSPSSRWNHGASRDRRGRDEPAELQGYDKSTAGVTSESWVRVRHSRADSGADCGALPRRPKATTCGGHRPGRKQRPEQTPGAKAPPTAAGGREPRRAAWHRRSLPGHAVFMRTSLQGDPMRYRSTIPRSLRLAPAMPLVCAAGIGRVNAGPPGPAVRERSR